MLRSQKTTHQNATHELHCSGRKKPRTKTPLTNCTGIYERVGFSSEEAVLLSHIWEAFLTNPTTGEPLRCYTLELTNMRVKYRFTSR